MNRIYSLVFNRALRQVQVASEHATRRRAGTPSGRRRRRAALPGTLAVALMVAGLPAAAQSLPSGHDVVGGVSGITIDGTTMTIHQDESRAAIRWDTFDIASGAQVVFDQAVTDVILNQVLGIDGSNILGRIDAPGTVFLINPNGIVFGSTAEINVGGLVASTLAVDEDAFLNGDSDLAMLPGAGSLAGITNNGEIVATQHGVTLVGGHIGNSGLVQAYAGDINLLGTRTATLSFDPTGRLSVAVDGAVAETIAGAASLVDNSGDLSTANGRIYVHANLAAGFMSTAVNSSGVISASGIGSDESGRVVLEGGEGFIDLDGQVTAARDLQITSGSAVSVDAGNLSVSGLAVDARSASIGPELDLSGDLSISVDEGGISQSGIWEVNGTTTLDSRDGGPISLDGYQNNFRGEVNLAGGNASIRNGGQLSLGALDVEGSLTATSGGQLVLGSGTIDGHLQADSNGGNIIQAGGLEVGGSSVLDAGVGAIVLTGDGNRFGGPLELTGGSAQISSDRDLVFGASDLGGLSASSGESVVFQGGSISGNLVVTAGEDIFQTGALAVDGTSTLAAAAGDIGLTHSDNQFGGAVSLTGERVGIRNAHGLTLVLGEVSAESLQAQATTIQIGSDIHTEGWQNYLGAVNLLDSVMLQSEGHSIWFTGTVDGSQALDVRARNEVLFDAAVGGTVALAGLSVEAGSFEAAAGLAVAGGLAITAGSGGIAQGAAWTIGGASALDAGADAIDLDAAGNDFGGAVSLTAGDVTLHDANQLTLGALDVASLDVTSTGNLGLGHGSIGGNLRARSNGHSIGQSTVAGLNVAGTSLLDAGSGAIGLAHEDNRFEGPVTATGTGIHVMAAGDLAIAGLTLGQGPGNSVQLEAGGTLTLPEESISTGSADLILASHGGALATAGTLVGANVTLTGADGIDLGHNVTGSTLTLHSEANISQSGGVLQMGTLHVNSDGSASLGGENLVGALGGVDVQGDFSLRNRLAIQQTLEDSDSVTIGGDAWFSSDGNVTLNDGSNHFGGEVSLISDAVEISVDDGLRLGDLDVTSLVAQSGGALDLGRGHVRGDLEATSDGDIGQSGALAVTGTSTLDAGTGAIILDDAGNRFGGPVQLTGGDTRIAALDTLQLGDLDVTALSATSEGNLDLGQGGIRGSLEATSTGGDIGQSGSLTVTGSSSLTAMGGGISLGAPLNNFGDVVSLTAGGDVLINDEAHLSLGDLDVGSLTVLSHDVLNLGQGRIDGNLVAGSGGGSIVQSGALQVVGTSALEAGGGGIDLTNAGNDFGGTVDLGGGTVAIRDAGALTLGTVSAASLAVESGGALDLGTTAVTGDLQATSHAGGITQSGGLLVNGDAALDAASGDIALDDGGNDFGGLLSLRGGAVSVNDLNTLRLGIVEVDSIDATAELIQLGNDVATSGDQTYDGQVELFGNLELESTSGDVTFTSAVDGRHQLVVTARSGAARFGDGVGATVALQHFVVDSDTLQLSGPLNVAGDMDLMVAQGGIRQSGAWSVGNATWLEAGADAIVVTDPGNDFHGPVSLLGGAVEIVDRNALRLGHLDVASLSVTSNGPLDLGRGRIGGNLQAYSDGAAISQSAALEVGGSSYLDAGSEAITLDHTGNIFSGPVHLMGGETSIRASGALTLANLFVSSLQARSGGALDLGLGVVDGSLEAISDAGGISQQGGLLVAGATHLDAGSGAITLDASSNDFGGQVNLAGGATVISTGSILALGSVAVSSLDATAAMIRLGEDITTSGDQAYNGLLLLEADRALESTAGDILFGGQVDGARLDVAARTGAVTFADAVGAMQPLSGLQVEAGRFSALSTLDVGGDLALTVAAGGIDQSAGWTVGGATALDAGADDIALTSATNDFSGTVDLAGGVVSIVDANALTLGTVDVASLEATAATIRLDADIATPGSQTYRGALTLADDRALESAAGDIAFGSTVDGAQTLDVAARAGTVTFTGAVGGSQALAGLGVDAGRLEVLSTLETSGDLALTAATGGIDQAGRWAVGGNTALDADVDAITLTDAGNDFAGAVDLAGGAVSIVDANALTLGAVDVASLEATATTIGLGRDISTSGSQDYRGALVLADDRALESVAGDITFASTVDGAHALDISAQAGTVTFTGAVGATEPLAGLNVDAGRLSVLSTLETSGDLALAVAQGGIDQAGAWRIGGAGALDAGAGGITLDLADNAFAGVMNLAGEAVTIVDSGTLALGLLDVASLDVTSHGDLGLGHGGIGGRLAARSHGGDISQSGVLAVAAGTTLDAGDGAIALDDGGNDFAGVVDLAGGAVSLADANALSLGTVDVASLEVGSSGALELGNGAIAGDLVARSDGGDISQSGALAVAGGTMLDAGNGAITLDDAGNDFTGVVDLAGGAVSLADANALTLGTVDVASLEVGSGGALGLGSGAIAGDLVANSDGGDIGQSGALAVAGGATLDAGDGAITLDDAGNDFTGVVDLAGGAVSLADANALSLGAVDVASLEVGSGGALGLGSGAIAGDLVARSQGGDIGQSGALAVAGGTTLDAGTGAIALGHDGNNFAGEVAAAGTGVDLASANDLQIASLDSGGAAVSLVAGGTLTLPASAIDSGDASVRLASLGGALATRGAVSGGNVVLEGGDGITLGDDVTAAGTLALEGGGAVTRAGGVLAAQTLTGRVDGAASLGGDNRISALDAFSADELELGTAGGLVVTGPVEAGSRLALDVGGDLEIHDLVSADAMRLDAVGGIGAAGDGRIVANTLSGSAGGPSWLGGRDRFVDNQVAVLGDFSSHAGFSMTSVGTLTLASVGDSEYSIDAGSSAMYLSIVDGDLLQLGTTPIRNRTGVYASTGHIGQSEAPIHVIGEEAQMVEFIGLPPAYFYANRADGTVLPVLGMSGVNVPMAVIAGRLQRAAHEQTGYRDPVPRQASAAYQIVQPGLRLPEDQCDPDASGRECVDPAG